MPQRLDTSMMRDLLFNHICKLLLDSEGQTRACVDSIVWFLGGDGSEFRIRAGEHDVEELKVVKSAIKVDVEEFHEVVALSLTSEDAIVAKEVQQVD